MGAGEIIIKMLNEKIFSELKMFAIDRRGELASGEWQGPGKEERGLS